MQTVKRLTCFFSILAILAACTNSSKVQLHSAKNLRGKAAYGDSIREGSLVDISGVQTIMQKSDKADMLLIGRVEDVCKEKGCWMTMKLTDGTEMRVTFKDYGFFVPQSLKGKQVILNGFAYHQTPSLEQEKHYAADAGKTEAEIQEIQEIQEIHPADKQIAFEANGVVVL
ncbi:MAG: hypothetical protein K0S09_988 [Sphingobacteriaceae bacterium]|jgi:hypothetical protein|nr:hypothetical protein [Sphingobacteriaceae bacterium]